MGQATPSSAMPADRACGEAANGFPKSGRTAAAVRDELRRLTASDHRYADGSVFNSICSAPLPLAAEVFAEHLDCNLGDNRIFPSLEKIERRVAAMLADLLGDPAAQGIAVSGGTEANLMAVLAALRRFQDLGGQGPPEVVVAESVHFSFDKLEACLPMTVRRARLGEGFRVDLEDLASKIGRRTALIVATAGCSEHGAVDDIEAIAHLASTVGVPLHVDAATGGFLIPFARQLGFPLPAFDFSLDGVDSITIDPHKYGGAVIPSGFLLYRRSQRFRPVVFASHYRGTRHHQTLQGTRTGAGLISTLAALLNLGEKGYLELTERLFEQRSAWMAALDEHGFELAYDPDLTILGVRLEHPESALLALERHGLIASMSQRYGFLRLVVQHHLRHRDFARLLDHLVEQRRRYRS